MDTQPPSCACLNVAYRPNEHPGGTKSDAWACVDCGREFRPTATRFSAGDTFVTARAEEPVIHTPDVEGIRAAGAHVEALIREAIRIRGTVGADWPSYIALAAQIGGRHHVEVDASVHRRALELVSRLRDVAEALGKAGPDGRDIVLAFLRSTRDEYADVFAEAELHRVRSVRAQG